MHSTPRQYFAAIDRETGNLLPWDPSPNHWVFTLKVSKKQSLLYLGGRFDQLGEDQRFLVAAMQLSDGSISDWDADLTGNAIYDLELSQDENHLYLGGDFIQVAAESQAYLARVDAEFGVSTDWIPAPNYTVYTLELAPDRTQIYAGGSFTRIGGELRSRLGAVQISDATATAWAPEPDWDISDIDVTKSGDHIYVAGSFSSIGGRNISHLARIKAEDGSADDWNPNPNHRVEAIRLSDDERLVFVGGSFQQVSGVKRERLALVYTHDGGVTDFSPSISHVVYDLLPTSENQLYIGGFFTQAAQYPFHHLTHFQFRSPATSANPESLVTNEKIAVSLTCSEEFQGDCHDIYFTTDGSQPDEQASKYLSSISITESTTLNFLAVTPEGIAESMRSETYIVDTTPPLSPLLSGPGLSSNPKPTWTWKPGGGGMGVFRFKIDDANLASESSQSSRTHFTPQTELSDGAHVFYIQEKTRLETGQL